MHLITNGSAGWTARLRSVLPPPIAGICGIHHEYEVFR